MGERVDASARSSVAQSHSGRVEALRQRCACQESGLENEPQISYANWQCTTLPHTRRLRSYLTQLAKANKKNIDLAEKCKSRKISNDSYVTLSPQVSKRS